jgi:hypothetical protein
MSLETLYRVKKTVLEMLKDRGYDIGSMLLEDLNEFKRIHGESIEFEHLVANL